MSTLVDILLENVNRAKKVEDKKMSIKVSTPFMLELQMALRSNLISDSSLSVIGSDPTFMGHPLLVDPQLPGKSWKLFWT